MDRIQIPSPNFAPRKPDTKVRFLILHYTACDLDLSLKILTDGQSSNPVSAHYLIHEDGTLYQLVDEKMSAWHAGVSAWGPYESLNTWSIGIELVNPGHGSHYRPFPPPQMATLLALGQDIQKRHAIKSQYVLGHADIAPLRKSDPGELLDWQALARVGLGIYAPPNGTCVNLSTLETQALLRAIGYHVPLSGECDPLTSAALKAFCYRCAPQHLCDPWSGAVLSALARYQNFIHT